MIVSIFLGAHGPGEATTTPTDKSLAADIERSPQADLKVITGKAYLSDFAVALSGVSAGRSSVLPPAVAGDL